jgi:hypothetical protein
MLPTTAAYRDADAFVSTREEAPATGALLDE